MSLSDPFSTTYQGSMQAGESLGQGIQQAAGSVADAMKQKQQQKQLQQMMGMIGMGKQSGAIKTETQPISPDEYNAQAEQMIQKAGPQIFKSNTILTGSDDPDERMQQYQQLFKAAGMQGPKTTKTITTVDADAMQKSQKMGWSYNPKEGISFHSTEVSPEAQAMKEMSMQMQEQRLKDSEEKTQNTEWDKLDKITDPNIATNRSPLGMAGRANMAADRALTTLNQPDVTNQEAGNVMADIASIYQSGNPTEFGMSEQGYRTIYAQAAGFKQWVTGQPQDALPDEIKDRLKNVLQGMKNTNTKVIKQNLNYIEKAHKNLIQKDPNKWNDIKSSLLTDLGDSSNGAQSTLKAAGMGNNQSSDYKSYLKSIGQ